MPLIEYHLSSKFSAFSIMTDIGPMKSILCEMPFNIVKICGPSEELNSQNRKAHDDKSAYATLQLEATDVKLPAYDSFAQNLFEDSYVPKMSSRSRKQALSFLANNIPLYIASIAPVKIILIERKTDSYYQEVKDPNRSDIYSTNGSQRRCIGNHSMLVTALASRFGRDFENISLERTSIFYQYQIFHSATVVVAQHGAALANAFFMREKTNIIEISPNECRDRYHFRNLATECKLGYSVVYQEEEHGNIDIPLVLQHVERCISSKLEVS